MIRATRVATRLGVALAAMAVVAQTGPVGASGQVPTASWTELHPTGTGPAADTGPTLAGYDPAANRAIVVAHHGKGNPDTVWVLTNANGVGGTSAWTALAAGGTAPVSTGAESATYDPAGNRLIVYGGCSWSCSPSRSDVVVLSNANGLGGAPAWTTLSVTNPQDRDLHSAVYLAASDSLLSFGGEHAFPSTSQNDTRRLSNTSGGTNPSAWTTLSPTGGPPPAREAHSAVYDPATDRMTVFGGSDFVRCCAPNYIINEFNDTWVLTNASGASGTPTWVQLTPANPPSPRAGHATVYDAVRSRMFAFGGSSFDEATQQSVVNGELWMLTNPGGVGGAPAWLQLTQTGTTPNALTASTAAWDAAHQRMILLGGSDAAGAANGRVFVAALSTSAGGQQATSVDVASAPGVLSVSVPQASVPFGNIEAGSASAPVSVGAVAYTNTLASGSPWSATVAATSLTAGGSVIPFGAMTFTPGTTVSPGAGATGTLTPGPAAGFTGVDPSPGTSLSDPVTLMTAPSSAQGSFTQAGSTVVLQVPASAVSGSYSGVLQYTVIG